MSKKILEIKLKSDLCIASGYAYAGLIDTDVCYNRNGIPYIPGKRIKGCLRDVAKYMFDREEIKKIFGKGDDIAANGLIISNAYPAEMKKIDRELTLIKNSNSEYKNYVSQQKVLDIYTRVKSQTAIDDNNGIALSNSLRFMRVVNQYSALDGKEMVFYAEIEYENVDDDTVEKLVKALRHIGMSRNRGLGNVSCRIISSEIECEDVIDNVDNTIGTDGEEKVVLEYVFTNTQPLMLSASDDGKSENYVNGQSILGALAGTYLKNNKNDEEFKDIFLSGKVEFSNAYITDDIGREYTPVPQYIRKLKKSKKIVNVLGKCEELCRSDKDYSTNDGNQPKKITSKYAYIKDNEEISFIEPSMSIIYHHTHKNDSSDEKLYSFRVLEENQKFAGKIVGAKKYIDILKDILTTMTLRLGKSKTAQYGQCKVDKITVSRYEAKELKINANEEIVVTLESDGIFIEDNAYTNKYSQVRHALMKQLGIDAYDEEGESVSYMSTKIITGYNTKWNMKRLFMPAVCAGSAFVFKVKGESSIYASMVGERNLEGYGAIRIEKINSMKYKINENIENQENTTSGSDINIKEVKVMLEKLMKNDLLDAIKLNAYSIDNMKLNASTVGRVSLMLIESGNDYEEFIKRVDSIKRKSEHDAVMSFIYKYIFNSDNAPDMEKMIGKSKAAIEISSNIDALYGDDKFVKKQQIANEIWHEYLKSILVNQKYKLAKGDK